MAGVAPPPDFAAFMRDMNKRIGRLERHRHPNILDPVSENEIGAVGINVCDGEAVIVGVGPDGVVRPVLSCGCGDPGGGGGDPSFCGASMGTWWTEAIMGDYVNETVIRFMGDPYDYGYLAETVTDGQVFDTYFDDEDGLPETPGAVAIRFIIKTTAGSSGTLEFETGMEGGSLAAAGDAVVSGDQEFIISAPGVTYADIQNGEYARIRTTVTDGSVNIQQIKLRIWPTGGMRGGWATAPSWDYQLPPKVNTAAIGNDSTYNDLLVATPGAAESVWNDVQAESSSLLSSLLGNSDEFTSTVFFYNVAVGDPLGRAFTSAHIQSQQDNFNSQGLASIGYDVLYFGPQPGSVIDYHPDITPVRHPDLVKDEEQSLFRTIGGGVLNSVPSGWEGPVTLHIEQVGMARKYYSATDTYEWKPFAEEFILTAGTVPDYPETRMSGPYPAVDGETPTPGAPATIHSETLGVVLGMDPDTGAADLGDITYSPPDGAISALEFKSPLPTAAFQNVDPEAGGPALHLSAVAGGGFTATLTEASYVYDVPASQYWSCSAS